MLTTVTEYNDYHWSDVLAEGNIELMTKKMEEFQAAIILWLHLLRLTLLRLCLL